jgi:hypothetical protein
MQTAAAFRAGGFEVRQSSHYVDPESGKGREIDVVALHPDVYGAVEIAFIAECKTSKTPWCLLSSQDTLANYNRLNAFGVLTDKARDSYTAPYVFAFPVIVVNSPILQCVLTDEGEIEVTEVAEGEWLFAAKIPEDFGACIRVVSLPRLPEYVKEAKALSTIVRHSLSAEQDEIFSSWKRVK